MNSGHTRLNRDLLPTVACSKVATVRSMTALADVLRSAWIVNIRPSQGIGDLFPEAVTAEDMVSVTGLRPSAVELL